MPTILINTNINKKYCKLESQQQSQPQQPASKQVNGDELTAISATEEQQQQHTENIENLDEEFRKDLNLIVAKLLNKSSMVNNTFTRNLY